MSLTSVDTTICAFQYITATIALVLFGLKSHENHLTAMECHELNVNDRLQRFSDTFESMGNLHCSLVDTQSVSSS